MSNDMSQTVPPKAAPNGENPRRGALVFVVVAFALIAMLAALPFLASRPRPAPDFAMTTLAGEAKTLETLAGRPILVSFWSTTCGPCMNEMPSLIAVHRRPDLRRHPEHANEIPDRPERSDHQDLRGLDPLSRPDRAARGHALDLIDVAPCAACQARPAISFLPIEERQCRAPGPARN
jgi:hypothetical protein